MHMWNLLMDLRKGPFEDSDGSQLNMLQRTSEMNQKNSYSSMSKNLVGGANK